MLKETHDQKNIEKSQAKATYRTNATAVNWKNGVTISVDVMFLVVDWMHMNKNKY